jgi:hypothetical protein
MNDDIEASVTKKNGSYEHIVDTATETRRSSNQTKPKEMKAVAKQDA